MTTLWDVRASRAFHMARGRIELMFDLFNVLNRGRVTAVTTLTGPNFNTQPIRILNPCIAKVWCDSRSKMSRFRPQPQSLVGTAAGSWQDESGL